MSEVIEIPNAAPAKPKNAIQIIEEQVAQLIKQREFTISQVHSIEGAIQGAQQLKQTLLAEVAKAEKIVNEVKPEATQIVQDIEAVAKELQ